MLQSACRRFRVAGFTLVELLVVIGIIAVLISILLPALNKARAAANIVRCAARLRQISNACQMYVNENRGYLPPITTNGNVSTGTYGRPTIFPQGNYANDPKRPGILTKYLGLNSWDLYACPVVANDTTFNPLYNYSYRYNRIIGGDDASRYPSGTTGVNFISWKLSQIKQSSSMALLADGPLQNGGSPTRFIMSFTVDTTLVNGLHTHTLNTGGSPGRAMHNAKLVGGGWVGLMNIAFCDGSVRGYPARLNTTPYQPFPDDVFIDPYHPLPRWP